MRELSTAKNRLFLIGYNACKAAYSRTASRKLVMEVRGCLVLVPWRIHPTSSFHGHLNLAINTTESYLLLIV